jgi:hypothetical protein
VSIYKISGANSGHVSILRIEERGREREINIAEADEEEINR